MSAEAITKNILFYIDEIKDLYFSQNKVLDIVGVAFFHYIADYETLRYTMKLEEAITENGEVVPYGFKRVPLLLDGYYFRKFDKTILSQEPLKEEISRVLAKVKETYSYWSRHLKDAEEKFGELKMIKIEIPKNNKEKFSLIVKPNQKISHKKISLPNPKDRFDMTLYLHRVSKFLQPRIKATFAFNVEDLL